MQQPEILGACAATFDGKYLSQVVYCPYCGQEAMLRAVVWKVFPMPLPWSQLSACMPMTAWGAGWTSIHSQRSDHHQPGQAASHLHHHDGKPFAAGCHSLHGS